MYGRHINIHETFCIFKNRARYSHKIHETPLKHNFCIPQSTSDTRNGRRAGISCIKKKIDTQKLNCAAIPCISSRLQYTQIAFPEPFRVFYVNPKCTMHIFQGRSAFYVSTESPGNCLLCSGKCSYSRTPLTTLLRAQTVTAFGFFCNCSYSQTLCSALPRARTVTASGCFLQLQLHLYSLISISLGPGSNCIRLFPAIAVTFANISRIVHAIFTFYVLYCAA